MEAVFQKHGRQIWTSVDDDVCWSIEYGYPAAVEDVECCLFRAIGKAFEAYDHVSVFNNDQNIISFLADILLHDIERNSEVRSCFRINSKLLFSRKLWGFRKVAAAEGVELFMQFGSKHFFTVTMFDNSRHGRPLWFFPVSVNSW